MAGNSTEISAVDAVEIARAFLESRGAHFGDCQQVRYFPENNFDDGMKLPACWGVDFARLNDIHDVGPILVNVDPLTKRARILPNM